VHIARQYVHRARQYFEAMLKFSSDEWKIIAIGGVKPFKQP
jgi:hypothetical protein